MLSWLKLIQQKIQGYGKSKDSEEAIHDYQRTVRESIRRSSRAEAIDFIELKDGERGTGRRIYR